MFFHSRLAYPFSTQCAPGSSCKEIPEYQLGYQQNTGTFVLYWVAGLTVFLKMRFQPSKGMSNGSHSTSTDVSRTDLNLSPSGSGKSARYKAELLHFIFK